MKLVTKFTNISGKEFDVRYDGKVLTTIGAGETIDLPIPEAKAAAKALANEVLGQRGNFSNWNADMVKLQAEILNDVPSDTPADVEPEMPEPVEPKTDYSKMSVKDLKAELDNAGIGYIAKMPKAELIDLLENPPEDEEGEEGEEEFPGEEA